MKKILLSSAVAFLFISCANTSSQFIHVSMPNFKPLEQTPIQTPQNAMAVNFDTIELEQNNNYSDFFQNSILKIRLDKEIELLKQNLEEQSKYILALKGFKVENSTNAPYALKGKIIIFIDENNIEKNSTWMSGDSVSSVLGLSFKAQMEFIDNTNTNNFTEFNSATALDSSINLTYPIKSGEGVNMFKTTISTVPTQLNRGLEDAAFEIDKTFLAFYKNTLETLYSKMPQSSTLPTPISNFQNENNASKNLEFNEFTPLEFNEFHEPSAPAESIPPILENNITSTPKESLNNQETNSSDAIIFE